VLGARLRAPAQIGNPARELVAKLLQRLQPQQVRARARGRGVPGANVGEAVGNDRRELALEPRHLRAQRASGRLLAGLDVNRRAGEGWSTAFDR
jgi:hypothetical protein